MLKQTRQSIIFAGGFFLFFIDRWFKFLSQSVFTQTLVWQKFFGWEPYQNPGIAFNLPLPNFLTIIFTVPVLLVVIFLLIKYYKDQTAFPIFAGLNLIFWGASSNLIDRIFFQTTLDYCLLGTGLINLADILIITGFVIILLPKEFFK